MGVGGFANQELHFRPTTFETPIRYSIGSWLYKLGTQSRRYKFVIHVYRIIIYTSIYKITEIIYNHIDRSTVYMINL